MGHSTAPWSVHDPTWLPSLARTAATYTTGEKGVDRFTQAILALDVTDVQAGGTLNVYLQTMLLDIATAVWTDIASLTQVIAAGQRVLGFVAGGNVEFAGADAALAAGTIRACPLGRKIRAKVVVGTNTCTFSLGIILLE